MNSTGWVTDSILYSNGATVLNEDRSAVEFASEEGVKAFETWKKFYMDGVAVGGTDREAMQAFAAGEAAMHIQSTSVYTSFVGASGAAGWKLYGYPMPGFDGKKSVPTNSGSAIVVRPDSEKKAQAIWEVIKYVTGEEGYTTITSEIGYLPLRPYLAEDEKYLKSFFIIELPEYKLPSLKRAVVSMLGRGKAYIIKAGTIILVCNTMVQIMQSFDWHLRVVEEGMESTSILATIASPIAFLMVPIVGIAAWQLAAAAVTGFIAKENVVGTLAVCYGLSAFIDTEELALVGDGNVVASAMALTGVAALSFLMFNLFSPPCFAALGAMNAEMQSKKWLWGGIALQLGTGYTVAFLVYQFGTLLTTGRLGNGFVPGLIAVFAMGAVVVGLIYRTKKRIQAEFGQPVVRKI